MTIKRDFEISETRVEQLAQDSQDIWADIDGVEIDPDDQELTICTENQVWARAWVRIGDFND